MTIGTETTTYRLTAVYDLREWDEAAEAYMDILPEEKSMCAHCGRLHAKVYEVTREQDRMIFTVGSSCSKNLFGWQPEKEEVRRLAKEAEKLAKSRAHQRLVDIATPIAESVNALSLPEIVYLGTKYSSQTPCYGMAGSSVEVLCREGLTDERRACCIDAWKREQAELQIEALYPKTSELSAKDTNARRRWKIWEIVRKELGVW